VTNILNDILLRVSAFGLFIYAVFSVIAGSLSAFTHEPNLLVMVTGILVVIEVNNVLEQKWPYFSFQFKMKIFISRKILKINPNSDFLALKK
jgi:hypothetical protein